MKIKPYIHVLFPNIYILQVYRDRPNIMPDQAWICEANIRPNLKIKGTSTIMGLMLDKGPTLHASRPRPQKEGRDPPNGLVLRSERGTKRGTQGQPQSNIIHVLWIASQKQSAIHGWLFYIILRMLGKGTKKIVENRVFNLEGWNFA